MLTWRTEENGIVIKGATAQYPHAVFIGNTDMVELIHVSNRLTPDELRQVADKLEELKMFGLSLSELVTPPYKLLNRMDGRVFLFKDMERVGHFGRMRKEDRLQFWYADRRETTNEEKDTVTQLLLRLNKEQEIGKC